MEQLQELLVDGLRDIYDAEKQLVKALPKLTKALSSNDLKQSFNTHLEQTKNQVTRVEKCLELLGEKVKGKPCKAMKGLVEEANEHVQEHEKGEVLDQVIVASAQKVEHYEIAAYGTAKAYAKSLGAKEALNLIVETLREEEGQDKALSGLAIRLQKEMGRSQPEMESDSGSSRVANRTSANSRAGAKKKVAARGSSSNGRSNGSGSRSSGQRVLSDHDEIRQWAEERGAHPACVRGTGKKGDVGMLRLDFPGYTGEDKLQPIEWDEFFEKFDERRLALLVQDKTARGQKSNFNKLVAQQTARQSAGGSGRRSAAR
jgi:ferritin-like metal-binding protein YciE